jgi:hypothetical protein
MGGRHRRPDDLATPDWEQAAHTERPRAVVACGCGCGPCGGGEHCHNGETSCNIR